jgi:hypothetical protein
VNVDAGWRGYGWGLFRSLIGIGTPYMDRFVLQTPWFEVRLHHILRSDDDRALHDHPFSFTSLLLTGGYREVRPVAKFPADVPYGALVWGYPPTAFIDLIAQHTAEHERYRQAAADGPHEVVEIPRFSLVRRRAENAHRLILDRPVWTLVLAGPRGREWGFYVPGLGWLRHDQYIRTYGDV